MAQAKHIGKIVLVPAEPICKRPDLPAATQRTLLREGSARWGCRSPMDGERGAGRIVLVGRSEPSPAARDPSRGLLDARRGGAHAARADVSDSGESSDHCRNSGEPPLRGIVHAAGVLEDATLVNVTPDQLRRVMEPKVAGAWNLHRATQHLSLDLFMLFSSVASVVGSPGQGSYSAANAFLDSLAAYRQSLGMPSLVVNWGPWAGEGMAAGHARRFELLGYGCSIRHERFVRWKMNSTAGAPAR